MEKVLVLNYDYTPINVTSTYKGFKLVYKGKAEMLKFSENPISTGIKEFVRPLIIRLLKYIKFRPTGIKVNRNRIYRRDNNECGYCGSHRQLTIDHIVPRSRGGTNDWNNLITCCHKCNLNKADRTPSEAGMVLRKKPYEPSVFSDILNSSVEKAWNDFKSSMGI